LDPPHASHPFQRDLHIMKSKNIDQEDIQAILDNIAIKNNKDEKSTELTKEAKIIIKNILDLSNHIPIENWLNDTGNRSII
jgi:hypothetical protein